MSHRLNLAKGMQLDRVRRILGKMASQLPNTVVVIPKPSDFEEPSLLWSG